MEPSATDVQELDLFTVKSLFFIQESSIGMNTYLTASFTCIPLETLQG